MWLYAYGSFCYGEAALISVWIAVVVLVFVCSFPFSFVYLLFYFYSYRNLPIKCPWALEIHRPKNGVGVYTEKPFVRITHIHTDYRMIKKRGWALTWRWALTRENTVLFFFSSVRMWRTALLYHAIQLWFSVLYKHGYGSFAGIVYCTLIIFACRPHTHDPHTQDLLRLSITVPHISNTLPLLSTLPLPPSLSSLLIRPLTRSQHPCSNLVGPSVAANSLLQTPGREESSNGNDGNLLQLYNHLDTHSCRWTFDRWLPVSALASICQGSVDGGFSLPSSISLYTAYVHVSTNSTVVSTHTHNVTVSLPSPSDSSQVFPVLTRPSPPSSGAQGFLYPVSIHLSPSHPHQLHLYLYSVAQFEGRFVSAATSSSPTLLYSLQMDEGLNQAWFFNCSLSQATKASPSDVDSDILNVELELTPCPTDLTCDSPLSFFLTLSLLTSPPSLLAHTGAVLLHDLTSYGVAMENASQRFTFG